MQIRDIQPNPSSTYEVSPFKKKEVKKQEKSGETQNISSNEPVPPFSNWQKDILLGALDKLENTMQVDNSHPLGKADAAPIESHDEAIIELSYVKSPDYGKYASGAQANIEPSDVLDLFTQA